MNGLNSELVTLARYRIGGVKQAFVPSDPAMGGAPPGGDPSGGGGAPPGGPPPMDPSGGGAPPPDPSAGGAPPPPPPGPDPGVGGAGMDPSSIAGQVSQGVSAALANSGLQGNKAMGPGGKPAVKPDINTIATDVFQLKKMLFSVMRHAGIELPPDVLDGPNRDPMTGAPAMSPTGGSDVQPGQSMQDQQQSSIPPIQPIQGAAPAGGGGGGGGMGKMGEDFSLCKEIKGKQLMSKAAAVAILCRRRREVNI